MRLNASDPDIQTLVSRISAGDLNLQPDFQRGEVWNEKKKQKLIDSILRDWHVPPIHAIEDADTKQQEILDGQQRLIAIRDFVEGKIVVDGRTLPLDPEIEHLHGTRYEELPIGFKRRFDRFSIRYFLITDYKPDEPWELFYRLNQPTLLTPAEQRNAFFGATRKQIKTLVKLCQDVGLNEKTLGFSNSRMAYDDILTRFCFCLENGTLAMKVGPRTLADLFRSQQQFSANTLIYAERSLEFLGNKLNNSEKDIKFNKATLFSWLCVLSSILKTDAPVLYDDFGLYIQEFERARNIVKPINIQTIHTQVKDIPDDMIFSKTMIELLVLFNLRTSSRVFDAGSVLARDFIIWYFIYSKHRRIEPHFSVVYPKFREIQEVVKHYTIQFSTKQILGEKLLLCAVNNLSWGSKF